jgi:hypothetical protein
MEEKVLFCFEIGWIADMNLEPLSFPLIWHSISHGKTKPSLCIFPLKEFVKVSESFPKSSLPPKKKKTQKTKNDYKKLTWLVNGKWIRNIRIKFPLKQ